MNKQNLFGFNFSVDRHEDGSIKASMHAELTDAGKQTVLGFISGALGALSDRYPDVVSYDDGEPKQDSTPHGGPDGDVNAFMNNVSAFMNGNK